MNNQETNTKLPYTPPMVSVIAISHEQAIATGSSSTPLSEMDSIEIFDEPFI
jgi:hypothetical protein